MLTFIGIILGMFGIGQISNQAGIFIVRVCRDKEHALSLLKAQELVVQLGRWVWIGKKRGNKQAENVNEPVFFCGHMSLDLGQKVEEGSNI